MSIDKREYHRIVADIPCRFGRELDFYTRQVNISAGGAAFIVKDEMAHFFSVGDHHLFSFELRNRHFEFESYVVRRSVNNLQVVTALQFLFVEDHVRKNLDTMILSMGGYQKDDIERKNQYLAWYAPQALHPHPNKQPQQEPEPTKKEVNTADSIGDLGSLDDMFKEFGA